MFRLALFLAVILAVILAVTAFAPARVQHKARTELSMASNDFQKAFAATMIGASLLVGGTAARAEVDYDGIKYLGGGDKIDINNANIRAYLKLPGVYPTAAGRIASNGPYKAVSDIYNLPGMTNAEKDALKKVESKFIVLDPKPEYVIDKINNGLYR